MYIISLAFESANVPEDLLDFRFLSVDRRSVSSDSLDFRRLFDSVNVFWWKDEVGFGMGLFVWYAVGGGCSDWICGM